MGANFDLRAVADRVDLPALIEQTQPVVRGMTFCPWHDNTRTPALSVYQDAKRRWRLRCHACGASGTALDWVMQRDGVTIVEAARLIDPSLAGPDDRPGPVRPLRVDTPHQTPPRPHVEPVEVWRDPTWQAEVDRLIALGERKLWGPEGADARAWLNARGILDRTAESFRLGFLDHDVWSRPIPILATPDKPTGRKLWGRRGVVIPYLAPGVGSYHPDPDDDPAAPRWLGANVRRLADPDVLAPLPDEPKCQTFHKTVRGHAYPWPELLPSQAGPPALVCEGEFDALLAHQQLGHLAHAVSVGGSNQTPKPEALAFLELCPAWLLATDDDDAGTTAARRWRDLSTRPPLRARLPRGCKDLTEAYQAGHDLGDWLRGEMVRLGPGR